MPALRTGSAGLNVSDLEASVGFYDRVLGLETIRRSVDPGRPWAHLGRAGEVLLTLWQQCTTGFAADRAGLHHLSFEVDDVAALRAVEVGVRGCGVALRDDPGVPGALAETGRIFLLDPDGIRIEVYADRGPAVDWSTFAACGFYEEAA